MSDPDIYPPVDPQNEELIRCLRNEINSLKSKLEKKDDQITTLENMVNTTMTCLNARTHGWADYLTAPVLTNHVIFRENISQIAILVKQRMKIGFRRQMNSAPPQPRIQTFKILSIFCPSSIKSLKF